MSKILEQAQIAEIISQKHEAAIAALIAAGIDAEVSVIHDEISVSVKDEDSEHVQAILQEVLAGWEVKNGI